jgi:hypothetical protein
MSVRVDRSIVFQGARFTRKNLMVSECRRSCQSYSSELAGKRYGGGIPCKCETYIDDGKRLGVELESPWLPECAVECTAFADVGGPALGASRKYTYKKYTGITEFPATSAPLWALYTKLKGVEVGAALDQL